MLRQIITSTWRKYVLSKYVSKLARFGILQILQKNNIGKFSELVNFSATDLCNLMIRNTSFFFFLAESNNKNKN